MSKRKTLAHRYPTVAKTYGDGPLATFEAACKAAATPFALYSARGIIAAEIREAKGAKSEALASLLRRVGVTDKLTFETNSGEGYRIPDTPQNQRAKFMVTFDEVCREILPLPDDPFADYPIPTFDGEERDQEAEGEADTERDRTDDGEGASDGGVEGGQDAQDGSGTDGDAEGDSEGEGKSEDEGEGEGSEGEQDQTPDDPSSELPDEGMAEEADDDESTLPPGEWMTGRQFLDAVRQYREYSAGVLNGGQPLDEIGYRPETFGSQMRAKGIPFEAVLHSYTMGWSEQDRRAVNVPKFDPTKLWRKERVKGESDVLPYMLRLATARVPICLTGPKGTGKTSLAMTLAERLGMDFGMVPMVAGATNGWLTGIYNLQGYVTRPFVEIYEHGGVFLFDELDAGNANLLLLVNGALANGGFANPTTGKWIPRHPDFIPVSAMNTLGMGASQSYTGRERLDAATLDRWACGRIYVGIDPKIEEKILARWL